MQRAEERENPFTSAFYLGEKMAEIIENEKKDKGVETYLVGRLPIWTSIDRFDAAHTEQIIAEVNSALSIHVQNLIAMEYLYWYRRGITPIYARTKTVREEINNKINVAHAGEIVDFKNGYFMTQPAFYVSRSDDDDTSEKVAELNEYLYRSGKQAADNKMVDWFHTVGKADLFVQSNDDDEKPFVAYALDPRSAFVARSLKPGSKPVYAVNVVANGDNLLIDVWDDTNVYTLAGTKKGTLATPCPDYIATASSVVAVKPNPLKKIPIIEYYYNSVQMGAFESVIPLLDAISALQSDRLDGVDQFIQSLLVFYNCELGEDAEGNEITPQLIRAYGMENNKLLLSCNDVYDFEINPVEIGIFPLENITFSILIPEEIKLLDVCSRIRYPQGYQRIPTQGNSPGCGGRCHRQVPGRRKHPHPADCRNPVLRQNGEVPHPQAEGAVVGHPDGAPLVQGRDSGALPQQDLLWWWNLRGERCLQILLWP